MTPGPLPSSAAPPGDRAAKLAVAIVAAAGVAILSAFFDRRLAFFALTLPPAVVSIGQGISDIGMSGYMFAFSGLVAVSALAARSVITDGRRDEALTALAERALYIFATLATAGLAAQAIKHLVGRARPRYVEIFGPYHFDILSMKNSFASFPSGHSATAFSMAVALSYLMPRARPPLLVMATAIALSRIVVEAHFASDIVVGGGLGIGTAMLVARWLAGYDFAFTWRDGAVRVKSPGAIIAVMRGRSLAS